MPDRHLVDVSCDARPRRALPLKAPAGVQPARAILAREGGVATRTIASAPAPGRFRCNPVAWRDAPAATKPVQWRAVDQKICSRTLDPHSFNPSTCRRRMLGQPIDPRPAPQVLACLTMPSVIQERFRSEGTAFICHPRVVRRDDHSDSYHDNIGIRALRQGLSSRICIRRPLHSSHGDISAV